ncbi:hypothetical protein Tco_1109431 [Tanacetum coccineum]
MDFTVRVRRAGGLKRESIEKALLSLTYPELLFQSRHRPGVLIRDQLRRKSKYGDMRELWRIYNMRSGVGVVFRLGEMSSPLYTVWGSLQDITVELFLGTIVGYDEANDSGTDMSFDTPASPEFFRLLRANMSFDMPTSLEYLSGLACASLAEAHILQTKLSKKAIDTSECHKPLNTAVVGGLVVEAVLGSDGGGEA